MTVKPGAHIGLVDVSHRYRNSNQSAVEDVYVDIEPASATSLIGRSGCGKSTLLHIMSGLTKPTEGKVYIDGKFVDGPSPKWIMMFQQASLYPWMSVWQNVSLGLRFTGRMRETKTRIPELLELVELSEYANKNVQELSGGQQQRVALARSLAVHPEILFLDEPFSALDVFTRSALQRDVRRITKDLGITLVLVTHDITEAVIMADRAIIMNANPGKISDDFTIGLSEVERLNPSTEFNATRTKLQNKFEEIVGHNILNSSPHKTTQRVNQSQKAIAV